ncbi:MAG: ImpA family metalloprotease [Methylococcales bacterium]
MFNARNCQSKSCFKLFLLLIHLWLASSIAYAESAPVFIGGNGHYAVAENATINTLVGFVKATDADDDELVYSLTDSIFQVDSTSGEITVNDVINRGDGVQRKITVSVSDGTTTVQSQQTILIVQTAQADSTGILLEHWKNIGGDSISNLTANNNYPDNPTQTSLLTDFETPSQSYGSYGQRVSGYLKVSESAEYIFWISSDDEGQLRLSTDTDPANLGSVIASVTGWTGSQQWDKYASQKSQPVYLLANRLYYIEALHKEGGGGDHVAVALQKAGESTRLLIKDGQMIPPSVLDSVLPSMSHHLGTDSVATNHVTLSWQAASDNIGIAEYTIYRDGVLLATVNGDVFTYKDSTATTNAMHTYQVISTDPFGNQSSPATLEVDLSMPFNTVEIALQTGDARHVLNDQYLVIAALAEMDASQNLLFDAKTKLFNLNANGTAKSDGSSLTGIDWDPTHDAALLVPTIGKNVGVLQTNSVAVSGYTVYNKHIAIAGETMQSRYLVMGSNPLRNAYRGFTVNDQMHQFMENSLGWLTGRNNLTTQPFNVVIAQMGQSHYFPDEVATRDWLDDHYTGQVSYNNADACDSTQLATCLTATTDLLIISQVATSNNESAAIAAAVEQALDQGIPVLYLHHDGNQTVLGKALFDVFNVTYHWDNYWKKLSLSAYDITQNLTQLPAALQNIKRMLEHFRDQDYAFEWSACVKENCSSVTGLDTEFTQGANEVRSMMRALDAGKQNIFAEDGFRLQKLLALIGDRFRQDAVYPMDKVTTDDTDFLKSYYADYAVYNFRTVNPAQPHMGNFSRSDFSHITPINKTINLTSKRNFRSTGAYAIPGKTFKITRNDNSQLAVKVFVNTLRSSATHQWAEGGYTRPKYLESTHIAINSGETIEITSPYGGPIQLEFSVNDLPVQVTIENIGEHPYWSTTADDTLFTQKLDAGDYDWAEVVTTGFEVHSTLEKMRQSMADPKWGSAEILAAATKKHMSNFPHVLAGFKGPGIDVVPEIHDFADAKGWEINNLDLVKHMNADQATCGYGCSGNPYDAYWSYDPIGHGDVHELGHGLQGGMRFVGWVNHSMTNYYSYYTKSKYHEKTNGEPSCQSLPFESQFNTLQASVNAADSAEYMKINWWDSAGWSQQASMFIQMMMSVQNSGALENGWHVRARLHIMEREFYRAHNSESTWLAIRDSLGFSDYSLTEAKAIDNNDWLLIAISTVTERDYRDYLNMWGIPVNPKAEAQVASFNYPAISRQFFMSSAVGYCKTNQNGDFLGKAAVAVDGTQTWPATTDSDADGYWDALDNCPADANNDQLDMDSDGVGDVCDTTPTGDTDNDEVDNAIDNCPVNANSDQQDTDTDGIGDVCDTTATGDTDNDAVDNAIDNCPVDANSDQQDTDTDGIGDACDTTPTGDTDNDTVDNAIDNCPTLSNTDQLNSDTDHLGNACDTDDDNDGLPDHVEQNLGLNLLSDDSDGDGVLDGEEDTDNDGYSNREEVLAGSDPGDVNSALGTEIPLINPQSAAYYSRVAVTLSTIDPQLSIHYTTDGSQPNASSPIYSEPIRLDMSSIIKAISLDKNNAESSLVASETYIVFEEAPWTPASDSKGHWQPQGAIDSSIDFAVYHIDLLATSEATINQLKKQGRQLVCYFSAGTWEASRTDANDFPDWVKGNALQDKPDEKWLNISDLNSLAPIMRARLETAISKGCDAVQPVNINGYDNDTGFQLTTDQQLIYNLWLTNEANQRGLSIGLSNDYSQIDILKPFFDWTLNQQCFEYNACDPSIIPIVEEAVSGKQCTLDADGNGSVDALTDGLLFIRHMFGIRSDSLISNAVDGNCTRCTAIEIEPYLQQCVDLNFSDIDGNGKVDALTDGLLSIRYNFGIRNEALVINSVAEDCTRCNSTQIEEYLQGMKP